jgi:hypothetical protein
MSYQTGGVEFIETMLDWERHAIKQGHAFESKGCKGPGELGDLLRVAARNLNVGSNGAAGEADGRSMLVLYRMEIFITFIFIIIIIMIIIIIIIIIIKGIWCKLDFILIMFEWRRITPLLFVTAVG